jgi:hypothetical protein
MKEVTLSLSELTESKITAVQKALPVMVRVYLVDKYGAVLPAVTGLRITIVIFYTIFYQRRAGAAPSTWRISPLT